MVVVNKEKGIIGLKVTKDLFETSITTAKALCEDETLSAEECEIIEKAFYEGQALLLSAKDVWDRMVEADSFDDLNKYGSLINSVVYLTGQIEIIIRKER